MFLPCKNSETIIFELLLRLSNAALCNYNPADSLTASRAKYRIKRNEFFILKVFQCIFSLPDANFADNFWWNTFSVKIICTFSFSHWLDGGSDWDELSGGARLRLGQSERQFCGREERGERCRSWRVERGELREQLGRSARRGQREQPGRRGRLGRCGMHRSFYERKFGTF